MPQAVILVGGPGTRLAGLTAATPKPLLPVGDRPFAAWLIRELARFGVRRFLLLGGHLGQAVLSFAAARPHLEDLDLDVDAVVEPEPLGTGGALRFTRDRLQDRFLLLNGDSWFDIDISAFWRFAQAALADGTGLEGAIALRSSPSAARFGVVRLEGDRVSDFAERGNATDTALINGGIYAFRRDLVNRIGGVCSLERDVLPDVARTGQLAGWVGQGYFIDIGVPEDYARAQTEVPAHVRRPAVFLDRDGVLNRDDGYISSAERFIWTDGVFDAIRLLNHSGYYVFLVTNQAGVARGYYTNNDVRQLHAWMQGQLRELGCRIDDIRWCPHHPEGSVREFSHRCDCRKPAAGMLLDLMECWPIEAQRSFLVGDKNADIEAAHAASISGFLYSGGNLCSFIRGCIKTLEGV